MSGLLVAVVSSDAAGALTPFGFPLGRALSAAKRKAAGCVSDRQNPWREFLHCSTAPRPVTGADHYSADVVDGKLRRVLATFAFTLDATGVKVRSKFGELKDLLAAKYGKPKNAYDFLHAGALWKERGEFAMALAQDERTLYVSWAIGKHHVAAIDAGASDRTTTSLTVAYEDERLTDLVKKKQKERDSKAF